jgi:uncharacterized protein YybS (DUF2232 family)
MVGSRYAYQFAGVGITIGLLWAAGVLGPMGMFLALLVPLPAAYVHMRHRTLDGAGVVVLSSGVLLAIDGLSGVVVYLMQFGLASFVLPLFLKRRMAWYRAIAVATLIAVGVSLVVSVGVSLQTEQSISSMVSVYIDGEFEKVLLVYQQSGLTASQLSELRTLADRTADFLLLAYPGLIVVGTEFLMLLTTFLLGRFSHGAYVLAGVPFRTWKAPDLLVWLIILGGFGVFFFQGVVYQMAVNLLTVILPIYFLQGLAVIEHYFQRKSVVPTLRILGYLMMVVVNPLPVIVAGIGIFDLWVDFRRPRIKKS